MSYNILDIDIAWGDADHLRDYGEKVRAALLNHYSYEGGGMDDDYHVSIDFMTNGKIEGDRIIVQIKPYAPLHVEDKNALTGVFGQGGEAVKYLDINMTEFLGHSEWASCKTVHESARQGLYLLIGFSVEAHTKQVDYMTESVAKKIEDYLNEEGLENLDADGNERNLSSLLVRSFIQYDAEFRGRKYNNQEAAPQQGHHLN